MVRVFATHETLLPTDDVPGMPIQYVYLYEHEEAIREAQSLAVKLEQLNAALQRVIARQDAMLVAKDEFSG